MCAVIKSLSFFHRANLILFIALMCFNSSDAIYNISSRPLTLQTTNYTAATCSVLLTTVVAQP